MTLTQKDVIKLRVKVACAPANAPVVVEVDAYALPSVPGLAVHRGILTAKSATEFTQQDRRGWHVLHIGSQFKIGMLWPTAAKALEVVAKLAKLTDWTKDHDTLRKQPGLAVAVRELYSTEED